MNVDPSYYGKKIRPYLIRASSTTRTGTVQTRSELDLDFLASNFQPQLKEARHPLPEDE